MAKRAHDLRQSYAQTRVPRYLQVASALRQRLKEGHWVVGDQIATLEELEGEFQVARVTVRQAIDLLQSEGLVKSYQGRGTFVIKSPESDRWLQLATDWASLIAPIRDNVPHLLPGEAAPGGGDPRPRRRNRRYRLPPRPPRRPGDRLRHQPRNAGSRDAAGNRAADSREPS